MNKQQLEKYNPANFRQLKQEDIDAMQNLTKDDVAELARAYPNKPSDRAYLVLLNTKEKAKQLYPVSTWQNLNSLWKQGVLNFVAFNFSSLHNGKTASTTATKTGPVQDLTHAEVTRELKNIPGTKTAAKPVTVPIKTAPPQVAKPVAKVNDDLAIDSDSDIDEPVYPNDLGSDSDFNDEEIEKEAAKKAKKKAEPKTVKLQPVKKEAVKKATKKK